MQSRLEEIIKINFFRWRKSSHRLQRFEERIWILWWEQYFSKVIYKGLKITTIKNMVKEKQQDKSLD